MMLLIFDVITGIYSVDSPFGISTVYGLALLLPTLAVMVRRLHDTGRSGSWLLIGLIPLAGLVVLIVFWARDSQPGDNQYGPNPKTPAPSP